MKKAVVTGGTGGIGAGVVAALCANGWQVVATGASEAEIQAFRSVKNCEAEVLDVTDDAAVSSLFARLDRLDGLVNCAGILRKEEEFDIATFQKVIDVNLTGTMRCCLAAREHLATSKGAIVNTGSMYSIFGGAHAPAYTASKGGVAQLSKSLAGKWGADGIRVNTIAPGWIETPMTEAIRGDRVREPAILSRTPLGRWGKPSEVGALVSWLLSDEASFITGGLYTVDGGYSAM